MWCPRAKARNLHRSKKFSDKITLRYKTYWFSAYESRMNAQSVDLVNLSVCPPSTSMYVCMHACISVSVVLSVFLSICLSVHPSVFVCMYEYM